MGEVISMLVFRPPSPPSRITCPYIWIRTDEKGNRIPALFIRCVGAKVTLLYSHGNSEDLGMMYPRIKELAWILQVNIFAYDYSGYGVSTGIVSEENCLQNIEAAYNYLTLKRGIPAEKIVLYGRSLGSGPSCYLAAKTAKSGCSVGGVILHSPFLSIFRVAMDVGFTMSGDMFPNIDYASEISCPVLIIHGTDDEVVPFSHGLELFRALQPSCRAKPFFAEGMKHNNIDDRQRDLYLKNINEFLSLYMYDDIDRTISSSVVENRIGCVLPSVLLPIDHI